MIFTETKLKGAYLIELEQKTDERGFFARSFCQHEFQAHSLRTSIAQCNISFNQKKGTLRGMHFQLPPKEEAKLVRCTQGRIYDVIIDLRPKSPTHRQWIAIELGDSPSAHASDSAAHGSPLTAYGSMLYIPEGFAHGFQTLEDDTEVFYHMFEFYSPYHASGVRWDDPAFGIKWPLSDPIISEKDRTYPWFKK